MMHSGEPSPPDQPTDNTVTDFYRELHSHRATMTSLYRQLDSHDPGTDASFDVNAGLQQLTERIRREEPIPLTPAAARTGTQRPRRPSRVFILAGAAASIIIVIISILTTLVAAQNRPGNQITPSSWTVPARSGLGGAIEVNLTLKFEDGQAGMTADDKALADSQLARLAKSREDIDIESSAAHANGTDLSLALRRAQGVADYLEDHGISANRIHLRADVARDSANTVIVAWAIS